jgi:hypothetical protein
MKVFAIFRVCKDCGVGIWFTSKLICKYCREINAVREKIERERQERAEERRRILEASYQRPIWRPPASRTLTAAPVNGNPLNPNKVEAEEQAADNPLVTAAMIAAFTTPPRYDIEGTESGRFSGGGGDAGGAGASGAWDNGPAEARSTPSYASGGEGGYTPTPETRCEAPSASSGSSDSGSSSSSSSSYESSSSSSCDSSSSSSSSSGGSE